MIADWMEIKNVVWIAHSARLTDAHPAWELAICLSMIGRHGLDSPISSVPASEDTEILYWVVGALRSEDSIAQTQW